MGLVCWVLYIYLFQLAYLVTCFVVVVLVFFYVIVILSIKTDEDADIEAPLKDEEPTIKDN